MTEIKPRVDFPQGPRSVGATQRAVVKPTQDVVPQETSKSPSSPTSNATQKSTLHATTRPSHHSEPTGKVSFGTPQQTNPIVTQVLSDLKGKKGVEFSNALDTILQSPQKREALISHFKLDSKTNRSDLGKAMILEAGTGHKPENMMPVGIVIINRALATNLAYQVNHNKPKNPPFSINSIITEKNQFESKNAFLGNSRASEGNSNEIQDMVSKLMNGESGNKNEASAFYFRKVSVSHGNVRNKMKHESFRASDGHSFSRLYDSGLNYVNGNYLQNR